MGNRLGIAIIAIAALLLLTAQGVDAQSKTAMPSSQDILEKLTPGKNSPSSPLQFRGVIVTRPDGQSPSNKGAVNPPDTGPSPSIDLSVNFEFGSAHLTPDARLLLDRLADALKAPALAHSNFEVAGHTDAKGSDDYNQRLSLQRARAVCDYLERTRGIQSARLTAAGYGRTRLLDPANPTSAINRRVQVTNLSAGT